VEAVPATGSGGGIMSNNRISDVDYAGPRKQLDPNRYATKKTIAQGMLDVALLTANASQLRYVLQVGDRHEFYTLMVALISISIILQILVGILMMVLGALDINEDESKQQMAADIINDITVIMVFLITLLNVIISGFGMSHADLMVSTTPAPASAG